MTLTRLIVLFAIPTFLCATVAAQGTVRVRGTITSLDGNVLSIKERDGRDLKLILPDNVSVAVAKTARFEEIKPGDFVGATTVSGADAKPVVVELHYLPPTVPEGQLAWDLQPNSTMTNANVASVVTDVGKGEITLQTKTGTHTMRVPEGTPVARSVPGNRGDLAVGEYIFATAQRAADGTLSAPRIQVSKDGVKPPM
jgi:hypothetical protein